MKKYFESKMKGLRKEDFAAKALDGGGKEDYGSSFLDDGDQVEMPASETAQRSSTLSKIEDEDVEDTGDVRPSNEYVLNVAFFSFLGFMAVQAVFALIANSESMLADSEAMSVDALTYLFNMCAERIKKQPYSEHELSLSKPIRERRRTMKRLYLELVPPFISVTTLIAVTVVCLRDSYLKLFGEDGEYDSTEQVDVGLMLIFSALNLLLDIVNVACFARADQAFGLPSMSGFDAQPSVDFVRMSTRGGFEVELQGDDFAVTEASPLNANDSSPPEDTFYGINLNMCSAWTHICADTMRSLAVLVAALIASVFQSVEGEDADVAAAVVVSIIIIVSLFPLLHGLYLTAREIVILSKTPIAR